MRREDAHLREFWFLISVKDPKNSQGDETNKDYHNSLHRNIHNGLRVCGLALRVLHAGVSALIVLIEGVVCSVVLGIIIGIVLGATYNKVAGD